MRPPAWLFVILLTGCSAAAPGAIPGAVSSDQAGVQGEAALLALADSIFAAAHARDADRFASFFSGRPDFVYLINTRRLDSRESLRAAFSSMLSGQQAFDPRWDARTVQMLTPTVGVLTGEFTTRARRMTGDAWTASGVVTFVAVRESPGWRVVNWHTTE